MRLRSFPRLLVPALLIAATATLAWRATRDASPRFVPATPLPSPSSTAEDTIHAPPPPQPVTSRDERNFVLAGKLLARLNTPLAQEQGRENEALLTFKDADAYRRFLARAADSGLEVIDRLDRFHTVRVRCDSPETLAADVLSHAADYAGLDANYFAYPPDVPGTEARYSGKLSSIGNGLLDFLGVSGDTSKWGAGVTIAILDSGIASDSTFGTNRLRWLDVGQGVAPTADNGHGTAVASLAGGMSSDATGIAPASNLLSVRVTATDGLSDSFTLSKGILAAVDAGAQVINVSMGSYSNSYVMDNAIAYASSRGALVVASAGNDQATELTWPAADNRVVSVGAVDAAEQQVSFSNSGDQLQITAPGYGLQAAWVNGTRVTMDGTSGSAPVVAGAIAAMMSQNPGMSASQSWAILQSHASDGGTPGQDANYGHGILNLGWATNRNNFTRMDPAVSSQYLDTATLEMQFVVQNRSAQSVNGLTLDVNAGTGQRTFTIPSLGPGNTYAVRVPVDYITLQNQGRIDYTATLLNPPGITDAVPSNNQRTNRVTLTQPQ